MFNIYRMLFIVLKRVWVVKSLFVRCPTPDKNPLSQIPILLPNDTIWKILDKIFFSEWYHDIKNTLIYKVIRNVECLKTIWTSRASFYLNKIKKWNVLASLHFCVISWKQSNCITNMLPVIAIILKVFWMMIHWKNTFDFH